jgi:Na+/H+-dicarboxylate symporter
MKAAAGAGMDNSLKALSRSINRPAITLAAIVLALVLGAMRLSFLQYLRPVGDFYIALLQICVLPFLLATIPLAVRSAMASGSAPGVLRSLLFWVLLTVVAVAAVSVMIPSLFFSYFSPDEQMITNIGALLGRSGDSIDVEFAIDARHTAEIKGAADSGIFALVPTNIFASLSSNDSVRVLVFAAIFGIGMVLTERQSGHSIFDALSHIQAVCALIFDWFSLLVPIGIVALSRRRLRDSVRTFTALTLSHILFWPPVLCCCWRHRCLCVALRASLGSVFGALLKPVMLGASTAIR